MTSHHFRRVLISSLLACCAAFAAACGGDEEGPKIPAQTAAALQRDLDEVRRRIRAENACGDLTEQTTSSGEPGSFPRIRSRLDALPKDLDADLRDALNDSFGKLEQLVADRCGEIRQEREDRREQRQEEESTQPETTPEETPISPVPEPEPEPEQEKPKKPEKDKGADEEPPAATTPDQGNGGAVPTTP